MIGLDTFAQTTDTPQNGASNAADFQPPTQNPQQPMNTQDQTGHDLQTPSGQDVLSNPNAHINVPVNPAPPKPTPQVSAANTNWLLFVMIAAVLAIGAWITLRSRNKVSSQFVSESITPEPIKTAEEAIEKPTKKKPAKPSKAKGKRKSKSKSKSKKK